MDEKKRSLWEKFFKPDFDSRFWLRLLILAAAAYFLFGHVLRPCLIWGESMEPTYGSFGITFCLLDDEAGEKADYGDIVVIRYHTRTLYLKRLVGKPGDRIQFIGGKLYRNGEAVDEPYVSYPCDWELPEETVGEGMVYVVGDNRSMHWSRHRMGQVDRDRIIGHPIW